MNTEYVTTRYCPECDREIGVDRDHEHELVGSLSDVDDTLADISRRLLSRLNPCYIVDIDGTIADISHRLHLKNGKHLPGGPKPNDDAFHDACVRDRPIIPVIETVRQISRQFPIILITGRREEWRQETEDWLHEHNVPFDELYMRPAGDKRPDYIVKRELYENHVKDRTVIAVFDDRSRVVDMWREIGLPCFQVAKGDY